MIESRSSGPTRPLGLFWVAAGLWGLLVLFTGPGSITRAGLFDIPLLLLYVLSIAYGAGLIIHDARPSRSRLLRLLTQGDALLVYSLLIFGFLYLFALNANLDYVQRFIRLGGQLQLSLNTATERAIVLLRFLPLLTAAVASFMYTRLRRGYLFRHLLRRPNDPRGRSALVDLWALPLSLLSALMMVLSLPSQFSLEGLGVLGFVALVPLFIALVHQRPAGALGSVFTFGIAYTLGANFWLATFSLVSIQMSVIVYGSYYLALGLVAIVLLRIIPRYPFLVLALLWVGFEWLRSLGFLGYPWGLLAHSQYLNRPLIQIAELGGQWAVTLVLAMVNAGIAAMLTGLYHGRRIRHGLPLAAAGLLLASLSFGYVRIAGLGIARDARVAASRPDARVALVQHNSDPRKAEYEATLRTLIELSEEALEQGVDMLAWSETAFVPNIRRWSEDRSVLRYNRLVSRLLEWQQETGVWLLTGNDDYELVGDEEGRETDRLNYNAAVLFDPDGRRRETYRKIRLVPFTEYFPWKQELPGVYQLLQEFDVYLWEPGQDRTVFEGPGVRFSTPICFEDVFPEEVRRFVTAGADVILNISNDYWSLTPVQARQHFASGLFRAVENRRPLLRSTASGVTAHVDETGRLIEELAPYTADMMIAELYTAAPGLTLYTRFGDWLPPTSLLVLGSMALVSLTGLRRNRRGEQQR